MPAQTVSTKTAEHYTWGGARGEACDGWYLLRVADLHIIEERMPPDTRETRHHHVRSQQFFYVLEGELTLEIEHHDFVLAAGDGIAIAPGQVHQAKNLGGADARILVTSQPPSHGDRVEDQPR